MVWVQYPGINTASSRLNHCNCFSQYRGSLAEEETIRKGRFAGLATCQYGASAVLSSNALRVLLLMKTLKNDSYGPQKLTTKSRAEFCAYHFVNIQWAAIFFGAIPIYRVLPYSIMSSRL